MVLSESTPMPTTPSTRGIAPRMSLDRAGRYAEFSWFNDLQTPTREFTVLGPLFTAQVWTNMDAAVQPVFGATVGPQFRKRLDLSGFTQARLVVTMGTVSTLANTTLRLQYTTDLTGATGWTNIDGAADDASAPRTIASAVRIDTATTLVPAAGAWVNLAAAARGDVLVRVVGQDGDGIIDPTFIAISIQCRH